MEAKNMLQSLVGTSPVDFIHKNLALISDGSSEHVTKFSGHPLIDFIHKNMALISDGSSEHVTKFTRHLSSRLHT